MVSSVVEQQTSRVTLDATDARSVSFNSRTGFLRGVGDGGGGSGSGGRCCGGVCGAAGAGGGTSSAGSRAPADVVGFVVELEVCLPRACERRTKRGGVRKSS